MRLVGKLLAEGFPLATGHVALPDLPAQELGRATARTSTRVEYVRTWPQRLRTSLAGGPDRTRGASGPL